MYYHQINPTETFHERHLALLQEDQYQAFARRLRAGRKSKAAVLGFLATLVMVAVTMLVALSGPAHAATTFTVNDTRDSPDASAASNTCDIDVFTDGDQCTLRAAIQQFNATPGADTINFAIPGTGVKTIAVGAGGAQSFGTLPAITEQVTIDGYTQPGASPNTLAVGNNAALKVELNGASLVSASSGLKIATSDRSVINRFTQGIEISGDSVANRIEGNFIGTDPTAPSAGATTCTACSSMRARPRPWWVALPPPRVTSSPATATWAFSSWIRTPTVSRATSSAPTRAARRTWAT